MQTLKLEHLHVERTTLKVPPAEEVITELYYSNIALKDGLAQKYSSVSVEYVDCPDLTRPPFSLAAKGLGGNPTVIQVGDPAYVVPNTLKEKLYDFRSVLEALNIESSFIVGAGGGCWPAFGNFTEMCANVVIEKGEICNHSKEIFSSDQSYDGIVVREADVREFKFACIGNLFACQGNSEKVIRISCRQRKSGNDDFPATINSFLKNAFEYPIAVGAIILMVKGIAEHHVAPTFAEGVNGTEQLMEWFLLPGVSAPFVSVGTLLTRNPPGWTLLNQHFHSFNERNEGGHYHFDFTPEEAEYEAYLTFADTLYSIDRADKAVNLFDYRA